MGRSRFAGLDAFGKTMEDVKVKTSFGGLLTLISFGLIVLLTVVEFTDYRRIHLKPSILVDQSRGEKVNVWMNITFPRVPCYLLSIDIMDISGEHQNDINHDITKSRLAENGSIVAISGKELSGDLARVASQKDPNFCGSCYGGTPPESGCCNTCDDVREAYVRRGWSFVNPDSIDQCVKEGWSDKIKAQSSEGCNVAGKVRINKVVGNFHLSPGRSFQNNAMHVHDLVPYLQGDHKHDFSHTIHQFTFASEFETFEIGKELSTKFKKRLNIRDPLTELTMKTTEPNYMYQYFLKVVSTRFSPLRGPQIGSHQYSVTQYERDLTEGQNTNEGGHQTSHGYAGVPGVFFSYEISPMLVIHRETRQAFAHFLTSTCAIVGGVLTVAGLVDSLVYAGRKKLAPGAKSFDGHAYTRLGAKF